MGKGLNIILGIIVLALVGTVFLVREGAQSPALEVSEEENTNNTPEVDEVVSIEVGDTEFSFSPESSEVERGSTVEFKFTNTGSLAHSFNIETEEGELLGGTSAISAGDSDSFVLTMPDRQTTVVLTSFCSVPGHREGGMVGEIVVE